ncbi:MAG: saccharopine dehydrogenase NADP-binding domain-containing protein [Nanoarchaeota archaeon]
MKVVILGYGSVGSVLSKMLSKEKRVKEIICCGINFKRKQEDERVIHKIIDLTDEKKLVEFLNKEKPDAVVNATHPKFNLNIMKACIKAKVNYIDTASFWDFDPNPKAKIPYKMEQTDHNKDFLKNNKIGLIEAGVAPGMDNLMAAECASELDEVDYIKIRMVEDTGSNEIYFPWNKEWLLDELSTKPIVYENGVFKLVDSFGAEEEYTFPEPIGKRKTYYFAQDEVGSIPLHIKTKKLDVKIHDNNISVFKTLLALGLLSEKKISVDGVKVKPLSVLTKLLPNPIPGEEKKFPEARFAMSVEAIGKINKKKKIVKCSIVFPAQKDINKLGLDANFISYPTALSIKLFLMEIPNITKRGVFPPEILEKVIRKRILNELKKIKQINFTKKMVACFSQI